MSAPRLTEADVHAACADIAARGERPTSLKLLEELGRGSLSTITKHLDSWKASEAARASDVENLPAEAVVPDELNSIGEAALKKLWQVAKRVADAEYEQRREQLDNAHQALQTQLEEACRFSEAQTLKIEQLEQEMVELRALVEQQHKQLQQKDKKINLHDMQIHKLQASLDLAVNMADEAKAQLKAANKAAVDAQKQVSNLEGQLAVYKTLDNPKKKGA